MRIAFVNHSRRKVGGAEIYLDAVIPAFAHAGHEVAFLYEDDTASDRELVSVPDGAPTWSVAEHGRSGAVQKLASWRPDLYFTHGISEPDLESEILELGPSALYVHNYYGTCISGNKLTWSSGRPEVCERKFGPACLLHYFPSNCGGKNPLTMWSLYNLQSRRLGMMHRYSALITNSHHITREMTAHGLQSQCVHYPVVAQSQAKSSPPTLDQDLRLIFAGRMTSLKGGQFLLDALPQAAQQLGRKLHVTLAGDGPDRSDWETTTKKLASADISIEFCGWLPAAALQYQLSRSHLLVYPSVWPEPFGLSGLEAGCFGVPSVAFAVGGIPEWLHDGVNGHLALPANATSLAAAIVRSLQEPEHYEKLRAGALSQSQQYQLQPHLTQLLQIFERCRA